MHVSLRGLQPEERRRGRLERRRSGGGGALAARDPRTSRSRRWGTSPRCGTSPPRSAAARASAARTFRSTRADCPRASSCKLAPFSEAVLQHFIHLERPNCSSEPDGEGFAPDFTFTRGVPTAAPHADGDRLRHGRRVLREPRRRTLRAFVARVGEKEAFCGDRAADLAQGDRLPGLRPGDLLEDGARGVRRHRHAGRGRAAGERGLALLPLPRDPRGAAAAQGREPGLRARASRRREPGAAPAGARRDRVWLENEDSGGHGRHREHAATC